jgi:hypothetical protein
MSRRVSDAIVASIKVDEQFSRFATELRCNFVPVLTVSFRQEMRKRRGGRLGDAVRGHFPRIASKSIKLSEVMSHARTPFSQYPIFYLFPN